jgi:hypothetical protein
MPDAADAFAELTRRDDQLFAAVVQAWEQAARSLAETGRHPGAPPEVRASLEAAYEFAAAHMLADQRDFARALMSVSSRAVSPAVRRGRPDAGPQTTQGAAQSPSPPVGAPTAGALAAGAALDRQPETTAARAAAPDTKPGTVKKAAEKKAAAKKTEGACDSTRTERSPAKRTDATAAPAKEMAAASTLASSPRPTKAGAKKGPAAKPAHGRAAPPEGGHGS